MNKKLKRSDFFFDFLMFFLFFFLSLRMVTINIFYFVDKKQWLFLFFLSATKRIRDLSKLKKKKNNIHE